MPLRPATPADIAFIRSLTTSPAYAPYIGDADEATVLGWIEGATSRVVIWEEGGAKGFAIFRGVGEAGGVVELFRIALTPVGGGRGDAFFAALRDHAFQGLGAARLWLDASGENPRAMKVYARCGMQREGVLRAHWWRPALGKAVDLHLFGMQRAEWLALRG